MDALVEGRGAIVSIMGEPGIGKTRLVWEVRDRYRDRVRFIEARGGLLRAELPYWPIRELLRDWLGVGASTPEARVRLELKAELAHLLGREEADEAYPFFATLLGVTLEPEATQRDPRAQPREHPVADVRGLRRARLQARRRGAALPRLRGPPLGRRGDARAARGAARHDRRGVGRALLPLPPRARARLLAARRARAPALPAPLPGDRGAPAPGRLARACSSRTPPRASCPSRWPSCSPSAPAATRSSSRRRSATWSSAARSSAETAAGSSRSPWTSWPSPPLVQGTLQARLDRLDPQTREVLSHRGRRSGGRSGCRCSSGSSPRRSSCRRSPSCSGSTSSSRSAAARTPSTASATASCRRSPTRASSTRSAASCTSASARRSRRSTGSRREEAYGLLARHFEEADEPEKAVDYLLKAGDAARAVYADQEALEHYRRARAFLARARRRAPRARHALQDGARLPPRVRLRERRGDVRRGVLLPRRRGPARCRPPSGSRPRPTARTISPPATSTRPRPATSPSCSSAGS